MNTICESIRILGDFCGVRDVETLTPEALSARFALAQADVMVLFGGSILCGGDVLAEAMRQGVARKYVIVGGAGHTTETLRQVVHASYPMIETAGLPEAEVFCRYLRHRHGLTPDMTETASTNCGNNITNLLDLLTAHAVPCESIILTQDSTMQRRMGAGLAKYRPDCRIIQFAAYRAEIAQRDGQPVFRAAIDGMWDMNRYISLLLGEIPRLTDDANGYGPQGKGYIAHVDVPAEVREAFAVLQGAYPALVREANPLYA